MPDRNKPTPATRSSRMQGTVQNVSNTPKSVLKDGEASAGYSIEITKSLGNYEFMKIRASVELPHGASQQLVNEMADLVKVAKELVIKRIEEDIDTLDFSN